MYLSDPDQMDWINGPFDGMESGPGGTGAKLLYAVMAHLTRPEFVYPHSWRVGDLLVLDNRAVVHAATWFDPERHERVVWRATVQEAHLPERESSRRTLLLGMNRRAQPAWSRGEQGPVG